LCIVIIGLVHTGSDWHVAISGGNAGIVDLDVGLTSAIQHDRRGFGRRRVRSRSGFQASISSATAALLSLAW
jgi:hypothetical protein